MIKRLYVRVFLKINGMSEVHISGQTLKFHFHYMFCYAKSMILLKTVVTDDILKNK